MLEKCAANARIPTFIAMRFHRQHKTEMGVYQTQPAHAPFRPLERARLREIAAFCFDLARALW